MRASAPRGLYASRRDSPSDNDFGPIALNGIGVPQPDDVRGTPTSGHRAIGGLLFLATLSTLLLELSLTRLFSAVLFYHYAFLVISTALLGLASGGILARLLPRVHDSAWGHRVRSVVCVAAAMAVIGALQAVLTTNVWLLTNWETFWRLALLFVVCTVPFGLAGFVIASVMAAGHRRIGKLYCFDLLGASAGCLLFVPAITMLGGPNAVLAVGALWGVSATGWAIRGHSRTLVAIGSLLVIATSGVIVVNRTGAIFDVHYTRGAPRKYEVFSKWNSFSRVSVHQTPDRMYWIEIDSGAGTWIPRVQLDGEAGRTFAKRLGRTGAEVAFDLRRGGKTLVIGAGGGFDVVRALAAGSHDVTAVEINPLIANDIMRGQFLDYSHGLYRHPTVKVLIEDGRSFVQRTSERYDVIQLSQVDTWATSAAGAYALTENYLYTVEALEAYLERLTPDGLLSITRWEFPKPRETLRLVAVAMEALSNLQLSRPQNHIVVLLENVNAEGGLQSGTVILSKSPFTLQQIHALEKRWQETPMRLAYAPGASASRQPFADLIGATNRRAFVDSYEFDVSPVFDDRPFFFFTGRWQHFWRDAFRFDPAGDSVNTGAQFLLLAVLVLSVGAVALFIIGPLLIGRCWFPAGREVFPLLGYCLAVGVAYIMVEIALIQRFVVYLGQPVYSLTVVLCLLLFSSGLGSLSTQASGGSSARRRTQLALAGIVTLLVVHQWLMPWVMSETQAAAQYVKLGIVAATVLPLGLLMGIPFPSGLRVIGDSRPDCIEWAWALNAAATVLGSVLALYVSVTVGISTALMVSVALYASATVLFRKVANRDISADDRPRSHIASAPLPTAHA